MSDDDLHNLKKEGRDSFGNLSVDSCSVIEQSMMENSEYQGKAEMPILKHTCFKHVAQTTDKEHPTGMMIQSDHLGN